MTTKTNRNQLPKLRPTPLTYLYMAFAVAMIVLFVWGFVRAAG